MLCRTGKLSINDVRTIELGPLQESEEDTFNDRRTSVLSSQNITDAARYSLSVPMSSPTPIIPEKFSHLQQSGSPIAKRSGPGREVKTALKDHVLSTPNWPKRTSSRDTSPEAVSGGVSTGLETKRQTKRRVPPVEKAPKLRPGKPGSRVETKETTPAPQNQPFNYDTAHRAARYDLGPKLRLSGDAHEIILGVPKPHV